MVILVQVWEWELFLGNLVLSFLLAAMLSPYANFFYMLSMKDVENLEVLKYCVRKLKPIL